MWFRNKKESETTLSCNYPLDIENYLKTRVIPEIKWHEKKADDKQNWFRLMQILQITFGAAIPVLSGFASSEKWLPWCVGILGALVTIITGLSRTFRFQELWAQYRATAESLKREQSLFLTQCKPYDEEDSFQIFVDHVECILDKENSTWRRSFISKEKDDKNAKSNTPTTPQRSLNT